MSFTIAPRFYGPFHTLSSNCVTDFLLIHANIDIYIKFEYFILL